jgi:hypothetical protein
MKRYYRAYPTEIKLCNIFETIWGALTQNPDCWNRESVKNRGGTAEDITFGENLTYIDPSGDVPAQVRAAPPIRSKAPTTTPAVPTTDTYDFNIFGKVIKIPKNITYVIIGAVLLLVLILALRR